MSSWKSQTGCLGLHRLFMVILLPCWSSGSDPQIGLLDVGGYSEDSTYKKNAHFLKEFFWAVTESLSKDLCRITLGELIAGRFCLPAAHWRNQPTTLHSFPWNLIVVGHWRVVCHHRTATVHMVCIAWRRREQASLRIGWMVTWNHWFRTVGTAACWKRLSYPYSKNTTFWGRWLGGTSSPPLLGIQPVQSSQSIYCNSQEIVWGYEVAQISIHWSSNHWIWDFFFIFVKA